MIRIIFISLFSCFLFSLSAQYFTEEQGLFYNLKPELEPTEKLRIAFLTNNFMETKTDFLGVHKNLKDGKQAIIQSRWQLRSFSRNLIPEIGIGLKAMSAPVPEQHYIIQNNSNVSIKLDPIFKHYNLLTPSLQVLLPFPIKRYRALEE